jgi:hypothetical protein
MNHWLYAPLMTMLVLGALAVLGAYVIGAGVRPGLKPAPARHRLPRNRRGH